MSLQQLAAGNQAVLSDPTDYAPIVAQCHDLAITLPGTSSRFERIRQETALLAKRQLPPGYVVLDGNADPAEAMAAAVEIVYRDGMPDLKTTRLKVDTEGAGLPYLWHDHLVKLRVPVDLHGCRELLCIDAKFIYGEIVEGRMIEVFDLEVLP